MSVLLAVAVLTAAPAPDWRPAPPHPQYQAYPPFSPAQDSASLIEWTKRNIYDGESWVYVDDRFATIIGRWDRVPPYVVAIVRYEVTTQPIAHLMGMRSMVRLMQINCGERTSRYLASIAFKGNNMLGGELPTSADNPAFSPFPDAQHTAEGALTDSLCRAADAAAENAH